MLNAGFLIGPNVNFGWSGMSSVKNLALIGLTKGVFELIEFCYVSMTSSQVRHSLRRSIKEAAWTKLLCLSYLIGIAKTAAK